MYVVDDLDDDHKPSKAIMFSRGEKQKKNGNLNVNVKMEDQKKSTDNFCFILFRSNERRGVEKTTIWSSMQKKAWFRKVENKFILAKSEFACEWFHSRAKRMKRSIILAENVVWNHAWVVISDMGIDQLRKNTRNFFFWVRS